MNTDFLPEWLHVNAVLKAKPPLVGGEFWVASITPGDSLDTTSVLLRTERGAEQTRTASTVVRDFEPTGGTFIPDITARRFPLKGTNA